MGLFRKKDDYDDGFGYTSNPGNAHRYQTHRYQSAYTDESIPETGRKKKGSTGKGILIGILIVCLPLAGILLGLFKVMDEMGLQVTVLPQATAGIVQKLGILETYKEKFFLFEDNYDEDKTADAIYRAYVDSLEDPYTCYYSKDEYDSMMESSNGSYYGIGVMISQNIETKEILIIRVFSESPAMAAGLQAGDLITQVAGEDVTTMDVNEAVTLIKGAEGSTVEVKVKRPDGEGYKELVFNVERRKVEQDTVYSRMLDDSIGYIELTEFEAVSTNQFKKAVTMLNAQGMKSLVLDLRNNPGGLLDVAVDIADIMIDTGLVVSMADKYESAEEYEATEAGMLDIPIVILVNGNSASAAEVLSGCLKDYGVAQLVGTQTFGKGIVQQIIPLPDGTAMKVTIAHYYTPNGTDIHGVGITPDQVVEDNPDTEADEQLEAAIALLKK